MSSGDAAAGGGEETTPTISTVVGTGAAGFKGEGEPAATAQVNGPYGVTVDDTGTLYFSDYHNHRVRKVTTDGRVSTVAGTGRAGAGGDGGPALSAQLNCPREVAVDASGTVYVADCENHRVRKITPDGQISTVAGTGRAGFSGDGGPATSAQLNKPFGLLLDSTGVLYIADWGHDRLRKVTADGVISTIAGTGAAAYGGDDGPAVKAHLRAPYAMVLDSSDALYIADASNHRVRVITPDGVIRTFAGTGVAGFGGDGGPAASAQLNRPQGLAMDSTGALYVADHSNHRVRKITPDGLISTVAGTGQAGFAGDGALASSAQLRQPHSLAVDRVDALYIADHANHRVRKLSSPRLAGLPDSGTVVFFANVRSKLRLGVQRESTKDGAEIHQGLPAPRDHQRWRLVPAGQEDGVILYRIENLRSGKVLEVDGAQLRAGAPVTQRSYEGSGALHQQWKLIPTGQADDASQVYEIANGHSGMLLRVGTNARSAVRQHGSEGDHRERQWQLVPV
ncbi:RICIN domain-containing protein [Streptomyces albidoflavus]|uniref:NHL domain-containing protein n=1 Tax=Streptomyces albidoflavus TaxID=1886 RepID=UPI0013EE9F82|nr:RICIN domain-containing protein [Streptomyces albidoflavus]